MIHDITLTLEAPAPIAITLAGAASVSFDVTGVGPQGPPGPAGGGAFEWVQSSPAAVWTITHPLDRKPSIVVIDSAGTVVQGDVAYPDNSTVVLTFIAGFSGVAELT